MKYAMDVKVNLKPVFSNMVHSDIWEGPCRVGLKEELDERCVDFGSDQDKDLFLENIAVCEDSLLESYLETGEIEEETVRILVRERKLFP